MYHPYFRGKQYELITIRETAFLLKKAGFHPIIEPVRETLRGLQKALSAVLDVGGDATLIVNPYHGDLSGAQDALTMFLKDAFSGEDGVSAGILLKSDMSSADAMKCYEVHEKHNPVFIHAGFTDAKALALALGKQTKKNRHVFLDAFCGKLYQKHFLGAHSVIVRDGFKKQRNADYELKEQFSDLHVTYGMEGADGFGDFLIVGDDYNEGGGPAYAVAIHLTFIDPDQDDVMFIYHFKSERQNTPTDPAGKFAEALERMMRTLNGKNSHVLETEAVKEFRQLHKDGHFPGLGYVKKLSMTHHIETLADYLKNAT